MIYISREQLLPLSAVPRHLPRQRDGRAVHVATVYRWASHGVGGVRLETLKLGGKMLTSVEAIQRFAEACTYVGTQQKPGELKPANRRAEQRRAGRYLDGVGIQERIDG